jgi:CBS domain-containing protein
MNPTKRKSAVESLKVQDHMNKHPVTFTENMPVAEAVERLLLSRHGAGPVVDQNGKVVGFLSEQDCIKQMIESTYYREQVAQVSDIMKTDVISVKPYDSILEIAEGLSTERPKVYPVIDDANHLIGTISRTDLLRAIDLHLQDGYKDH